MRGKVRATDIDYETASRFFYYDPFYGILYWQHRDENDEFFLKHCKSLRGIKIFNGQAAGKAVGTEYQNRAGNKYLTLSLTLDAVRKNYTVHRIAWLLMTKEQPEEVDHIDGNGLNNCFYNLRNVDRSTNSKNHRLHSNNKTTGVMGVRLYVNKKKPLWQAYSYDGLNKKQIQLGNYDNLFDAVCARKSYEWANGYTERHGR